MNLDEKFFFLHSRSFGKGIVHRRRKEIDRIQRWTEQGVTMRTRQPILLQPDIDDERRAIEIFRCQLTEVFASVIADRCDVTEKIENQIELNVGVGEKKTNQRIVMIDSTRQRDDIGEMFDQIGEMLFVHLRCEDLVKSRFQRALRLKNLKGIRMCLLMLIVLLDLFDKGLSSLSNEKGQFLDFLVVRLSKRFVRVAERFVDDAFEDVLQTQFIDAIEKILIVEKKVFDRLFHAIELRLETRGE